MKTTFITLTILYLPFVFCKINFKNNACPNLLVYSIAAYGSISRCHVNPDVLSDVPRMVERNGYDFDSHTVTTEDNYLLTIFEVSKKVTKKLAIFIQHGISSNSGAWVDIGNRSLAYYFADRGYRVFLGNTRGTTYSNQHNVYRIDDPNYWAFNLDTVAARDLDTQLSFVFEKVGHKIHYVGHSMGTTLAFMFFSTSTKKADQWIKTVSLLAPVAYLDGTPAIAVVKGPANIAEKVLSMFKLNALFYHERELRYIAYFVCMQFPEACRLFLNTAFGDTENLKDEDLLLVFSYYPTGTSILQLKHYLQIYTSKKFQKYDFGPERNLLMYGKETPPAYNLTNFKLPVCFFYGENDRLYTEETLERDFGEIGSIIKCKHSVTSEKGAYNHIDFLYAENIVTDLYEKLFKFIREND